MASCCARVNVVVTRTAFLPSLPIKRFPRRSAVFRSVRWFLLIFLLAEAGVNDFRSLSLRKYGEDSRRDTAANLGSPGPLFRQFVLDRPGEGPQMARRGLGHVLAPAAGSWLVMARAPGRGRNRRPPPQRERRTSGRHPNQRGTFPSSFTLIAARLPHTHRAHRPIPPRPNPTRCGSTRSRSLNPNAAQPRRRLLRNRDKPKPKSLRNGERTGSKSSPAPYFPHNKDAPEGRPEGSPG